MLFHNNKNREIKKESLQKTPVETSTLKEKNNVSKDSLTLESDKLKSQKLNSASKRKDEKDGLRKKEELTSNSELFADITKAYNEIGRNSPGADTLRKIQAQFDSKSSDMHAVCAAIEEKKKYDSLSDLFLEQIEKRGKPSYVVEMEPEIKTKEDAERIEKEKKVKKNASILATYYYLEENASRNEMVDVFDAITFDVSDLYEKMHKEDFDSKNLRNKVKIYEKIFAEVLKWKPEDFSFSSDHGFANDKELSEKLYKLGLIPVIRDCMKEYRTLIVGIGGDRRHIQGLPDASALDSDLIVAISKRIDSFDNIRMQYEGLLGVMGNTYYPLIHDGSKENITEDKLAELSKVITKNWRLIAMVY